MGTISRASTALLIRIIDDLLYAIRSYGFRLRTSFAHGSPSAHLPIYGTVRAAGRPGAGGAASREPLFNAAHPARHVASAAHSCVEPRAMIL